MYITLIIFSTFCFLELIDYVNEWLIYHISMTAHYLFSVFFSYLLICFYHIFHYVYLKEKIYGSAVAKG